MAGRVAYYGGIVKDGLILDLDAAKKDSYPTTGTVWSDISGNSNNGTLINGPTFNSDNGGSIVFDGVNDTVDCGNSTTLNSSNITYNTWVRRTASWEFNGSCLFWAKPNGTYTGNGFYIELFTTGTNFLDVITDGASINRFRDTTNANSRFPLNTWVNFCFTLNGSTPKMYFNGVDSTIVITGTNAITPTNSTKYLMSNSPAYGNYTKGDVSQTSIYNRALSAQEVLQNYNALKGRYGL